MRLSVGALCSGPSRRGLAARAQVTQGRVTANLDRPCARRRCPRTGRDELPTFLQALLDLGIFRQTSQAMSECIHQILATNRYSRPAPFEVVAAQLLVNIQS